MAQVAEIELPLDEAGHLRQQLATLERIRDQQRAALEDMAQQMTALRLRVDSDMRGSVHLREVARELTDVRSLIRDGDTKEALFQLERTLSFLDGAWRVYA